jgi:4-carboxymuconolactone decarboxylase
MDDEARRKSGEATRREVLGDEWVDRSLANRTAFNADWVDYITRTAWGDVWQRPGLDRRARSIVVLSICVANGQWDEFRLHLRGALNNGLTQDEIKEILIQCAVYASVPAANHAFKEAAAFFKEAGV